MVAVHLIHTIPTFSPTLQYRHTVVSTQDYSSEGLPTVTSLHIATTRAIISPDPTISLASTSVMTVDLIPTLCPTPIHKKVVYTTDYYLHSERLHTLSQFPTLQQQPSPDDMSVSSIIATTAGVIGLMAMFIIIVTVAVIMTRCHRQHSKLVSCLIFRLYCYI